MPGVAVRSRPGHGATGQIQIQLHEVGLVHWYTVPPKLQAPEVALRSMPTQSQVSVPSASAQLMEPVWPGSKVPLVSTCVSEGEVIRIRIRI